MVPPPVSTANVNPVVVGIGVLLLLMLFGASFYYVVVWPKRALLEYRHAFEDAVSRDKVVGRGGDKGRGGDAGEAYSGAAMAGSPAAQSPSPGGGKERKAIPTFARISEAREAQEMLKRRGASSPGNHNASGSPSGGLLFAPDPEL